MTNPYHGEVEISLNGAPQRMRLTLGALAELEEALGAQSLVALIERFEQGRFSGRELMLLLFYGLKGGGWPGTIADLASASIKGGMTEAARAAGQLITRAFGPT